MVHELDDPQKPQTEIHCGMNLNDLLTFYAAFKNHQEIDQIVFWLIKYKITRALFLQVKRGGLTNGTYELEPDLLAGPEIVKFTRKACSMGKNEIN